MAARRWGIWEGICRIFLRHEAPATLLRISWRPPPAFLRVFTRFYVCLPCAAKQTSGTAPQVRIRKQTREYFWGYRDCWQPEHTQSGDRPDRHWRFPVRRSATLVPQAALPTCRAGRIATADRKRLLAPAPRRRAALLQPRQARPPGPS